MNKTKCRICLTTNLFFFILISKIFPSSLGERIDSVITQLDKKYSFTIYYNNIPDSIHSKHITFITAPKEQYAKLLRYLTFFSKEFNKYSTSFINTVHLRRIAIVTNLASDSSYRNAVPDSIHRVLYYDYDVLKYGVLYSMHVLHHEFYHLIELDTKGTRYYKDPLWANFNEKGFEYGHGGKYCYNVVANFTELIHPYKGFINLYSMSALEEDKCEIFATLMVAQDQFLVCKWMAEHDKIIEMKVKYMKNFLHSICSEMNNKYWKTLN
jgi:hypothetical protein